MFDNTDHTIIEKASSSDKVLAAFLKAAIPDFWPKLRDHTTISIRNDGEKSIVKIKVDMDHIEYNMDSLAKTQTMKRFAGDMNSLFRYSGTEIKWDNTGIEITGNPDAMLKAAEWSPNWDYTKLITDIKKTVASDQTTEVKATTPSNPSIDIKEANPVATRLKAAPIPPKPRGYNSEDMAIVTNYLKNQIKKEHPEVADVEVTASLKNQRTDIRISITPSEQGKDEDMRVILENIMKQLEPMLKNVQFLGSQNNLDIRGKLSDIINDIKTHDPVGYLLLNSKRTGKTR